MSPGSTVVPTSAYLCLAVYSYDYPDPAAVLTIPRTARIHQAPSGEVFRQLYRNAHGDYDFPRRSFAHELRRVAKSLVLLAKAAVVTEADHTVRARPNIRPCRSDVGLRI